MSAFVVTETHIRVIITACLGSRNPNMRGRFSWHYGAFMENGTQNGRGDLNFDNADAIGSMLWLENERSVAERYQSERPNADACVYRHGTVRATSVEVLKAIKCLEYQSCEHREWHLSSACGFLIAAREWVIAEMDGYEDAPWVWDNA